MRLVVTIDGPAGSGKSTVAQHLAVRIGATFLDTGAMYRAVTFAAVADSADLADDEALARVIDGHTFEFAPGDDRMTVRVDERDVSDEIRDPELTSQVRHIAVSPTMRARLVQMQRAFADRHERIVTEGRDQGTVAFPDADVKFFLIADAAERARRRKSDLDRQGCPADLDEIRRAIEARDESDRNRAVGPLKPADDAVCVDTTHLGIDQVIETLVGHVKERCPKRP